MKKAAFLVLAISILFLSSCKKEYSCECTYHGTTTTTGSDGKMSKKSAEEWCENSTYCKLK